MTSLAVLFILFAFVLLPIVTVILLREYNLRNVIANYPRKVFTANSSLSSIEKPFAEILYEIVPHSGLTKSRRFRKFNLFRKIVFLEKPIGYDFITSHYAACLGNLSEVARRTFTHDSNKINILQEQARNLYEGVQFRNTDLMLISMANTYRIMKNCEPHKIQDSNTYEIRDEFKTVLHEVKNLIDKFDIFKAYIDLIAIEKNTNNICFLLNEFNDKELICYEAIKLKLESFFQSYKYPTEKISLEKKITEVSALIDYVIKTKTISSRDMAMNFC